MASCLSHVYEEPVVLPTLCDRYVQFETKDVSCHRCCGGDSTNSIARSVRYTNYESGSHSRWIRWRRELCHSNCQGARCKGDRHGIDRESGSAERTWGRCSDRLHETKIRRRCEGR